MNRSPGEIWLEDLLLGLMIWVIVPSFINLPKVWIELDLARSTRYFFPDFVKVMILLDYNENEMVTGAGVCR